MGQKASLRACARACYGVVAVLLVFAAAATRPAPAAGGQGLLVGVTEDMFKLEPALARSVGADLGLGAARISLHWDPGQTTLKAHDAGLIENALSTGVRVVLAVYGWHDTAPQTAAARDVYCGYVGNAIARYPQIRDVVIWNEPNISYFWRPQFDSAGSSVAPAAYADLLARCWDVLHDVSPTVNVIAPATSPWGTDDPYHPSVVSHSPTAFIRKLGAAYKASGRTRPIFDTVGHHAYGERPGERPWRKHSSSRRISQGDLEKLVDVLKEGFAGTAQGVPGAPAGARVVPIWYMEAGFETVPDDSKRSLYVNTETTAPLPDFVGAPEWEVLPEDGSTAPDQATQLRDAVRLAYCQPYVTGFFNFLLRDQAELNYWQSGVLWADRTPKDSYGAFRRVVAEVAAGSVDCARFGLDSSSPSTAQPLPPGTSQPALAPPPTATQPAGSATSNPGAGVPSSPRAALSIQRVVWPRGRLSDRRVDWRVGVRVTRGARYSARITGKHASGARGARRLVASGRVAAGRLAWIRFPRRRLASGTYRVTLTLQSPAPGPQAVKATSAPFRVVTRRTR